MKKLIVSLLLLSVLCVSSRAAGYSATVLGDSPTIYYRLGEGSGTSATDSSGNSHTGTYSATGVTYGSGGRINDGNTAVTMNGVATTFLDSGVNATASPGTNDFSVEVWVKNSNNGGVAVIAGKNSGSGDNYWLGMNVTAGKATWSVNGASVNGTITINDNAYHHIVGVRDFATLRLYVDGTADGTAVLGAGACSPGGNLFVGEFGSGNTSFNYSGTLDEFAFYLSKLSPTQVTAHYTAGIAAGFTITPTTISPRSTGIVLTLAGTGTSWNGGTTVFTVSGAATKTSQSVSSTTAATVTVDTSTSSGTATVTETVTGSSVSTTSVLPYKLIQATPGPDFVGINIYEPANFTAGQKIRLLYYHHGLGEDQTALTADNLKAGLFARNIADGYLQVGVTAGSANWGNASSCQIYSNVWTYLAAQYNLDGTIVWSQSMGGLCGLLNLGARAYGDVRGWIGVYPACNLTNMFANPSFTASVTSAYGISGGNYSSKTAGHDPVLLNWTGFKNMPMRFYASTGDTVVPETNHTDVLRALVAGHAREFVLISCTGDHGDPSHFQPVDFSAFCARAFNKVNPAATGFFQ
jgi:hypothetical protein